MVVRRKAQRLLDRDIVGVPGYHRVARLRLQGLADPLHQRLELRVELVAARIEHALAADAHEDALRVLVDGDQALLDLRIKELGEYVRHDHRRRRRRRHGAEQANRPDRRQLGEQATRIGGVAQGIGEAHEHQGEDGGRHHGDHPGRNVGGKRPMNGREPAPMRRQIALEIAAPLTQGPIDALADAAVLGRAAISDAQAALESERQADIHQLQDIGVVAGILVQVIENLVEAFTAHHLVVEGADHAPLRP